MSKPLDSAYPDADPAPWAPKGDYPYHGDGDGKGNSDGGKIAVEPDRTPNPAKD